ncbi:MAG: 50S ribosomal protein L7ae [Lachnospiraceae bacterium]|nr:50S ribosomal protein L7ae [Lachnospiraceae bacterium]
MKQNKVLSLLGIAMRGRNLVSGEFQTLDAVKTGAAMLVIIAEDASANTKKLFTDKCSFYEVPVYSYGTKEALGRAIGKDLRSSLGVCDAGLADAIVKQLKSEQV